MCQEHARQGKMGSSAHAHCGHSHAGHVQDSEAVQLAEPDASTPATAIEEQTTRPSADAGSGAM